MTHASRFRLSAFVLTSLLGGTLLGSCASSISPTASNGSMPVVPEAATAPAAMPMDATNMQQANLVTEVATAEVPRSQPQLIKTAELMVTVESVEDSIADVTAIARQQQGDVLGLQDQTPRDDHSHHIASLQL